MGGNYSGDSLERGHIGVGSTVTSPVKLMPGPTSMRCASW